jgi:hypothetical protein
MAQLLGPSAPGYRAMTIFSLQIFTTDDEGRDVQIGTAMEFSPNHTRTNTPVGGVGIGDLMMEIVPGRSRYTVSLRKFSLWNKRIQQVFGYNKDFRMLAEMQAPFEIRVFHLNPNPESEDEIEVTVYTGCVIASWDRKQEWQDDVTIVDDISVDVTRIHANKMLWPSLSALF